MKLLESNKFFVWLTVVLLAPLAGYIIAYLAGWEIVKDLMITAGILECVGVVVVMGWSAANRR